MNHKTASLSRREIFALTSEEATALVRLWKEEGGVAGAMVLSTCNRLEIYYDSSEKITRELESRLLESLYRFKQVRHRGDESIFVTARHDEAVLHLFRLASGLE
ncbi:MAG: glutamyl-tRNA reductase, partial [Porphyromonadaceae bacterium]|nr:glutamyl-tRNA reductase [Porphyromonadaceae bacterium]